jgi:hypothetical protein
MNEALPEIGPEREIFIEALRDFSEGCEAPQLIAECPFSVDISVGQRGCGEECRDLIARYGASTTPGRVEIGEFSLFPRRRPRSRRGPGPSARAFDASEIFLADAGLPVNQWKTTSLIFGVLRHVMFPSDERAPASDVDLLIAQLLERGVDAEGLVRNGMSPLIAGAIVLAVIVTAEAASIGGEAPPVEAPTEWVSLLESSAPDTGERIRERLASLPRLTTWVHAAPLDEILNWQAPKPEEFRDLSDASLTRFDPNQWLVERFTRTYLDGWSTESLHHEWRYLHAQVLAPCSPAVMAERRIDERDLSCEIAHRAVDAPKTTSQVPLHGYVDRAAALLGEGRRHAAADMFKIVTEVDKDHTEALNNYGFCILPDDPERALTALRSAAQKGWGTEPVNIANRVLALATLGRRTAALQLAEEHFTNGAESRFGSGYLWDINTPLVEPKLIRVDRVDRYIAELAARVAEETGDNELAVRWRKRCAAMA